MKINLRSVITVLIILLGALFIVSAWVGDDTYITMRVVDNFIRGYGLRWNVVERVQVFTHPFWMLMLALGYLASKNAFITIIGLSILISFSTIIVFFIKIPRTILAAAAGFTLLLFSKSFIDFSVSGLENPLTHLLLILFLIAFLQSKDFTNRAIFQLSLLAGLATFNRMDTILIFLPAIVYIFWSHCSSRTIELAVAGFLPFLLWEFFSLIYYGFLLPNTFYAKLNTGISTFDLIQQGLLYFKNSLLWDPLTLPVIGMTLGLVFFKAELKQKLIAAGVLLYLFYILYIGGDYMSGRFFSAPYFASVIMLVPVLSSFDKKYMYTSIIASILLGMLAPFPAFYLPTLEATDLAIKNNESPGGITDEKAYYFQSASLLNWRPGKVYPTDKMARRGQRFHDEGKRVSVEGTIGFMGFFGGAQLHIIDGYALGDALLARLPVNHPKKWRISHFSRQIPAGYYETIESGQNLIEDPNLARYYDKLHIVISGDLWTLERWQAIWELNMVQSDFDWRDVDHPDK